MTDKKKRKTGVSTGRKRKSINTLNNKSVQNVIIKLMQPKRTRSSSGQKDKTAARGSSVIYQPHGYTMQTVTPGTGPMSAPVHPIVSIVPPIVPPNNNFTPRNPTRNLNDHFATAVHQTPIQSRDETIMDKFSTLGSRKPSTFIGNFMNGFHSVAKPATPIEPLDSFKNDVEEYDSEDIDIGEFNPMDVQRQRQPRAVKSFCIACNREYKNTMKNHESTKTHIQNQVLYDNLTRSQKITRRQTVYPGEANYKPPGNVKEMIEQLNSSSGMR